MGKQTATIRQRGSSNTTAADSPQQQQHQQQQSSPALQYKSPEEVTTRDKLQFYVLQYIGLVFCAAGVAVLAGGYDRGWMPNTALCWVCLILCLIGLFFHEFRPFNVSSCVYGNQ
jgi:FtsH-binding integral membrane protein